MTDVPGEVDLVVWGAGIAGSQAAVTLAELGRSVLVFPRGPGSYPALPGFAIEGDAATNRATVEQRLLDEARQFGAIVAQGQKIRSLQPGSGPVRSVLTATENVSPKVVILADGSDPRIARARGLIPDWEPWHLVHFAYQQIARQPDQREVRVIAGIRDGGEWRGYSVPLPDSHMIVTAWFLEHEMATHVHVRELLPELQSRLDLHGEALGEVAVEVTPFESGEAHAALAGDNVLVIGDMAGLIDPFSLRRVRQSRLLGERTARLVDDSLKTAGHIHFGDEAAKVLRSSVQARRDAEAGLAMPVIPGPARSRKAGLAAVLQRFGKRSS